LLPSEVMDSRPGLGHPAIINNEPIGTHLRQWRKRRRMSQLNLACDANISPRHLSFVETGRASPSREMILHLAEQLQIPARERNVLLVAGGFAPVFPERNLSDPKLAQAREAVDFVLESHKPLPAYALDRHWNVVASNEALQVMYQGVAEALLQRPVNALRLSLHPQGLAPRIENLSEWRFHLLQRLRGQIELTADPVLISLERELLGYPVPPKSSAHGESILVPLKLRVAQGVLSFLSTTMIFGTALDITLSELAVEAFFPADAHTRDLVARLAAAEAP
jgi:transcriptional regulator with XRE-family HTH domain